MAGDYLAAGVGSTFVGLVAPRISQAFVLPSARILKRPPFIHLGQIKLKQAVVWGFVPYNSLLQLKVHEIRHRSSGPDLIIDSIAARSPTLA